jgi:hypothetical protein
MTIWCFILICVSKYWENFYIFITEIERKSTIDTSNSSNTVPLFLNSWSEISLHKQQTNTWISGKSFSSVQCSSWPFKSQFGCFLVVTMLVWTHSTMHYRKAMTKLNENNVTYVIQTLWSGAFFCTAVAFFCNKIIETDWFFLIHDHLMHYHNL